MKHVTFIWKVQTLPHSKLVTSTPLMFKGYATLELVERKHDESSYKKCAVTDEDTH